jgi:hypothetical protein
MCFEIRLSFWPDISDHGQPITSIPNREDGWKLESSARVLSRAELEAVLTQNG